VGDYEQLLLLVAGELLPVRVSPSAPRARRCCPCADNPPVGDSHVTFQGLTDGTEIQGPGRGGKKVSCTWYCNSLRRGKNGS
jgi:hypothetical protein